MADTYPAPLVITSITNHLYCLGVYMVPDMVVANGFTPPSVQLTGYVVSGTYTGAGTLSAPGGGSANLGVLQGD